MRGCVLGLVMLSLVACNTPERAPAAASPDTSIADLPDIARRIVAGRPAPSIDVFEVWVCSVPPETTDPIYGGLALRIPLTPAEIADRTEDRLRAYFAAISAGAYSIELTSGGTIDMTAAETPDSCVARALDASSPDADAVLAVATAEHAVTAPGGWGRPGSWVTCTTDCTARATRRAVYVGASDFHPDWGSTPALDLLEHEIGHTLGLPHSGDVQEGESGHTSALDVMSNSAAPRDVDPSRLDGPDTLAVNRLALGWMPVADVVVASRAAGAQVIDLVASTDAAGARLLLLPVGEHVMLSVELLVDDGFGSHLPASGLAVHRIDDTTGAGTTRAQQTLGSPPPHTDLLEPGERLSTDGWTIEVRALGTRAAQVAVEPDDE